MKCRSQWQRALPLVFVDKLVGKQQSEQYRHNNRSIDRLIDTMKTAIRGKLGQAYTWNKKFSSRWHSDRCDVIRQPAACGLQLTAEISLVWRVTSPNTRRKCRALLMVCCCLMEEAHMRQPKSVVCGIRLAACDRLMPPYNVRELQSTACS